MLGLRSWWSTAMNREQWRKLLKEAKTDYDDDDDDDDDAYLPHTHHVPQLFYFSLFDHHNNACYGALHYAVFTSLL
jgi:hypothetical protein